MFFSLKTVYHKLKFFIRLIIMLKMKNFIVVKKKFFMY